MKKFSVVSALVLVLMTAMLLSPPVMMAVVNNTMDKEITSTAAKITTLASMNQSAFAEYNLMTAPAASMSPPAAILCNTIEVKNVVAAEKKMAVAKSEMTAESPGECRQILRLEVAETKFLGGNNGYTRRLTQDYTANHDLLRV